MMKELLFILTVLSGKVLSQSSCKGYCTQYVWYWTCECDVDCVTRDDCCYDYHTVCGPTPSPTYTSYTLDNYKIVADSSRDVNIGSYSFAQCKSHCASDSGCYYFTFIYYQSQCYTYNTYNSLQYDSSAISVSYAGRFKTTTTTTTTPAPTTTSTTAVPTAPYGCYVMNPGWIGDKACDGGAYNIVECQWDGGDCCMETNSQLSDNAYCKNPAYSTTTTTTPAPTTTTTTDCYVSNPDWLGDKQCDDTHVGYNTEECQWDGGDCCKETNADLTSNYNCRDPSYSTTTTAAEATLAANASKSKSSMIEGVTTGLVWVIIIIVVVVVIVLSVLLVLYFRKRARKGMEQTFYVQMADTPQ